MTRYNHVYGIDLADNRELIAHGRTEEEIRQRLDCDSLTYLPLESLTQACYVAGLHSPVDLFETGLFSGRYVTGNVPQTLTIEQESLRKDIDVTVVPLDTRISDSE